MLVMWIEEKFMNAESHETLLKYASKRKVLVTTDLELIRQHAIDIDIVLGDFPRQHLPLLPNLVWFQQFGTGVEWLQNYPELIAAPFTLSNCSDSHYDVVADHALALVLAVLRGIPTFVQSQQNKKWQTTSLISCDSLFQLRGKTVLIVGLGSVGLAIVQRLKAFGVTIIGLRKNVTNNIPDIDKLYKTEELLIAAQQANIIISTLPKTDETDRIFNKNVFNNMPKPSFFFNIGRGNAVEEAHLIKALDAGDLNGAGLDVASLEPLSHDSPLWLAKNILITPHVGGTYGSVIATWRDLAIENLALYSAGKKLRNLVIKSQGY